MPATYGVARDEILGAFRTKWDADTPAVTPGGTVPPVIYPVIGEVGGGKPEADAWAEITIDHTGGEQTTLSGETGNRRFTKRGLVVVMIFTPLSWGKGASYSEALVKIAQEAFEGERTANGVWFRNVRPREIGIDGPWYQVNVLAEFEYDEVK